MNSSARVVITGITRGLGRALAHRFHEAGWTIAGCGRNSGLIDQLRRELGTPHRVDTVDVRDFSAVKQWADDVLTTHGPPQLILNNAATMNRPAPLWDVPVDEFQSLLDINIAGTFHVIKAFVPALCAARSGVIVNFSSGWGRSTSPEVAPYCATKWAIEGLTQALAQELPHGVATVALNPGIIDTDMLRTCWGEGAAQFPDPDTWSHRAAQLLLSLHADDNGRSLSVN